VREDLDQLRSEEGELVDEVGGRFQDVVEHEDDVFAWRFGFAVGGTAAGWDVRDVHGVDVAGRAG